MLTWEEQRGSCIKKGSLPASLAFIDQLIKHTTVKLFQTYKIFSLKYQIGNAEDGNVVRNEQ